MARLVLAVLFVGILVVGTLLTVRWLRAAIVEADQGKRFDMADGGMLPKLAYALLLALIVYATVTANGV